MVRSTPPPCCRLTLHVLYPPPPAALSPLQHVLPPREFGATNTSSKLGEDVFVCEYQYDEAWQVRGLLWRPGCAKWRT